MVANIYWALSMYQIFFLFISCVCVCARARTFLNKATERDKMTTIVSARNRLQIQAFRLQDSVFKVRAWKTVNIGEPTLAHFAEDNTEAKQM